MKKHLLPLLLLVCSLFATGCQSFLGPERDEDTDTSELPWNQPAGWEQSGGLGVPM